jgi:hypothetical protein
LDAKAMPSKLGINNIERTLQTCRGHVSERLACTDSPFETCKNTHLLISEDRIWVEEFQAADGHLQG